MRTCRLQGLNVMQARQGTSRNKVQHQRLLSQQCPSRMHPHSPVYAFRPQLISLKLHHHDERHRHLLAGRLNARQHPVHLCVVCEAEDELIHDSLPALGILAYRALQWSDLNIIRHAGDEVLAIKVAQPLSASTTCGHETASLLLLLRLLFQLWNSHWVAAEPSAALRSAGEQVQSLSRQDERLGQDGAASRIKEVSEGAGLMSVFAEGSSWVCICRCVPRAGVALLGHHHMHELW